MTIICLKLQKTFNAVDTARHSRKKVGSLNPYITSLLQPTPFGKGITSFPKMDISATQVLEKVFPSGNQGLNPTLVVKQT